MKVATKRFLNKLAIGSVLRSHIRLATLKRTRAYFLNAVAARRSQELRATWLQFALSFVPWLRSFRDEQTLTRKSLPWLSYPAISFLQKNVRPEFQIFEFGSGASTLFFANHCQQVYTVEHDTIWAQKVRQSLQASTMHNCKLRCIAGMVEVDNSRRSLYGSASEGWTTYTFENYVKAIDEHPDKTFDLVLVDGRARSACVLHAIKKVRPGGILVLDNSERPQYQTAISEVPREWARFDFPGPSARADFFSRTTIWIVPKDLHQHLG